MVLEQGVIEGRKIFGNIIKYIKMTASSNFGNMLSVLAASIFLPFLPMLPIQILVLNLIYVFPASLFHGITWTQNFETSPQMGCLFDSENL